MTLVLKNVQLCADGRRSRTDALLEDGRLVAMEPGIPVPSRAVVLEKPNIVLFPGLIDVHAKRAKAANLDAIHDTVHEMARDEARHGKAFEGLLKRYFG